MRKKYAQIAGDLRLKIGSGVYASGQKLPGQVAIMREYGVSLATARRALEALKAEGLVESSQGKATIVRPWSGGAPRTRTRIGFINFGSRGLTDPRLHEAIAASQPFLDQAGADLILRDIRRDTPDEVLRWAEGLQGVLAVSPSQGTAKRLVAAGVPLVVYGEMFAGECPVGASQVSINITAAMETALGLLACLGHRRILFTHGGGPVYAGKCAVVFDEQAPKLFKGAEQIYIESDPNRGSEYQPGANESELELLDRLRSGDPPFTALLMLNDCRACRMVHLLRDAGLSVPERISVLAFGASTPSRLPVPTLTRLYWSSTTSFQQAIATLLEMIATGRCVRTQDTPRLIVGDTCCPPLTVGNGVFSKTEGE